MCSLPAGLSRASIFLNRMLEKSVLRCLGDAEGGAYILEAVPAVVVRNEPPVEGIGGNPKIEVTGAMSVRPYHPLLASRMLSSETGCIRVDLPSCQQSPVVFLPFGALCEPLIPLCPASGFGPPSPRSTWSPRSISPVPRARPAHRATHYPISRASGRRGGPRWPPRRLYTHTTMGMFCQTFPKVRDRFRETLALNGATGRDRSVTLARGTALTGSRLRSARGPVPDGFGRGRFPHIAFPIATTQGGPHNARRPPDSGAAGRSVSWMSRLSCRFITKRKTWPGCATACTPRSAGSAAGTS